MDVDYICEWRSKRGLVAKADILQASDREQKSAEAFEDHRVLGQEHLQWEEDKVQLVVASASSSEPRPEQACIEPSTVSPVAQHFLETSQRRCSSDGTGYYLVRPNWSEMPDGYKWSESGDCLFHQ